MDRGEAKWGDGIRRTPGDIGQFTSNEEAKAMKH